MPQVYCGGGLRSPGQWTWIRAALEPRQGLVVSGMGGTVRPTRRPHTGHAITSPTWRCETWSHEPGQSSRARATRGAQQPRAGEDYLVGSGIGS